MRAFIDSIDFERNRNCMRNISRELRFVDSPATNEVRAGELPVAHQRDELRRKTREPRPRYHD
jgi:hypothetical protein